jgi:hypothetical protein
MQRNYSKVPFKPQSKNSTKELKQIRQQQENRSAYSDAFFPTSGILHHKKKRKKKPHIPPFAQIQPSPEPCLPEQVITSCLSVMGSLNKKQMIGICFLYLIMMGHAADTAEKVQNKNAGKQAKKHEIKQQTLKAVCEDKSIPTYNKPNITVGIHNGVIIPKVCLTNNDHAACELESSLLNGFNWNAEPIIKRREKRLAKMFKWRDSIEADQNRIINQLNSEQTSIFIKIIQTIYNLKPSYLTTQEKRGGNCQEHMDIALISLLNKKIKYGLDLKIQTVTVLTSNSINKIDSHIYLLLDSNQNDVSIKQNKDAVSKVLNQIKGTICDSWNHGYHHPFQNDDSGFYDKNAGWDTLKIMTYSLNFADFNKLPLKAQKFVCKQLKLIGLEVGSKDTCLMYNRKPKVEEVEKVNQPQQACTL